MSIIEFLEARIAEDEATAREISECESTDPKGQGYVGTVMEMVGHKRHGVITVDPARLLAECAAKLHVLYTLRSYEPADEWYVWKDMGERGNNAAGAVRVMAAVYKDHPDYRKEWAL